MRYSILIVIILCAQFIWAQSTLFSEFTRLDTTILTKEKNSDSDLLYCNNNNEVFYTLYNSYEGNDTITINSFELSDFKINKKEVYIRGVSSFLIANYSKTFESFSVNNYYIAFGIGRVIYFYNRMDGTVDSAIFKNEIGGFKFVDTHIIIAYENYNYSRFSKDSYFFSYDLSSKSLLKFMDAEFDCIKYTHITPNNWIDIAYNKILFSNTLNYSLKIYDYNLKLIDSIKIEDDNWNTLNKKDYKKICESNLEGINAINKILPLEDKISRITHAFFINDSTILIYGRKIISESDKEVQINFFDILVKENNIWNQKYKNFIDEYSNGVITADNYPLFKDKTSRKFLIIDNHIVAFMNFAPINPIGLDVEEYKRASDSYFLEKSPELIIFVYSIKL